MEKSHNSLTTVGIFHSKEFKPKLFKGERISVISAEGGLQQCDIMSMN
jgi:hypothetical protein